MARQYFDDPVRPFIGEEGSLTAITGGTAAVNLWTVATWTAFAARSLEANQMWLLEVWGIATWPVTTPGTTIVQARYGQSATPASNTTFGASQTVQGITLTAVPWVIRANLHVRTIGSTGTASCVGVMQSEGLTGKAAPFGGTVATIDTTAAGGLAVDVTPSVTGQSFTPQGGLLTRKG